MKQIEYNEKQKLVLEVLDEFDKRFSVDYRWDLDKIKYHERIKEIKAKYGIIDKYPTLREYITDNQSGAYHAFHFIINGNVKVEVRNIQEFEAVYNRKWLDMFYVLSDKRSDNGGNCENYHCDHELELVLKED